MLYYKNQRTDWLEYRVPIKTNSVALASPSDFVKASRVTSFYMNEFQGRV